MLQPITAGTKPWQPWLIAGLLFVFMLVNYADKAVIGLAAVPIMRDLHLSATQYGDMASSFFWLYPFMAIAGGFAANRLSSRWLLLAMGITWSVAQFPLAGAAGLTTLYACRILLGAGEGPAFAVGLHAVYKWFPNDRRTVPTALLALGSAVGAATAAFTLPSIIMAWDWHAAFLTVGLVGVAWSAIWLIFGREGKYAAPQGAATVADEPVSYLHLLTCRTLIGTIIIEFVAYWSLSVGLLWLPAYLVKVHGYTGVEAGQFFVLPTLAQLVLMPLVGLLADTLKRRGVSGRKARGFVGGVAVIISAAALAIMAVSDSPIVTVLGLVLAFSIVYAIFTVGPPLIAEVSPSGQRGALLGVNAALYSMAGLVAGPVMGRIIDAAAGDVTLGYRNGFLALAAIQVVGGLIGMAIINPERDLARFARLRGNRAGSAVVRG